jgi:crotonobetainyl-CoA:carnitine CoA-transferase CaiB-like acyl-CoA transferase
VINRVELIELMRAQTVKQTTNQWIALLETVGVPCGPINTVKDVFDDPHIKARGVQISMQHPQAGPIPLVASPIRLSETPVEYRLVPPPLGQDTDLVLKENLGLSLKDIASLRDQGVFG